MIAVCLGDRGWALSCAISKILIGGCGTEAGIGGLIESNGAWRAIFDRWYADESLESPYSPIVTSPPPCLQAMSPISLFPFST